jgi:hypothetical protein
MYIFNLLLHIFDEADGHELFIQIRDLFIDYVDDLFQAGAGGSLVRELHLRKLSP